MNKYITTATLSFALIAATPSFSEETHKKEDAHKHDEKGHANTHHYSCKNSGNLAR